MKVRRIGCIMIIVMLAAIVFFLEFRSEKRDSFYSPKLYYAVDGCNNHRHRLYNYSSLSQNVDYIPSIAFPTSEYDILSMFVKNSTIFLITREYRSDYKYICMLRKNRLVKNRINVGNTAQIIGLYNQKVIIADYRNIVFYDLHMKHDYIKPLPINVYLGKSKGLSGNGLTPCVIHDGSSGDGYFGLFSIQKMTVEKKFPEMRCRAGSISEDGTTVALFDNSSIFSIVKLKGISTTSVHYFNTKGNIDSSLGELSSNGRFLALMSRGHFKIPIIPYGGFFLWAYDLQTGKIARVPEGNVEYQCFSWSE